MKNIQKYSLGVQVCSLICLYGFIQDLFSRYIVLGLVFLIRSDLVFNIMSFDRRINFRKLLLGNMSSIVAISVMFFFALLSLFFERPFLILHFPHIPFPPHGVSIPILFSCNIFKSVFPNSNLYFLLIPLIPK